jgi:hypothetical protein
LLQICDASVVGCNQLPREFASVLEFCRGQVSSGPEDSEKFVLFTCPSPIPVRSMVLELSARPIAVTRKALQASASCKKPKLGGFAARADESSMTATPGMKVPKFDVRRDRHAPVGIENERVEAGHGPECGSVDRFHVGHPELADSQAHSLTCHGKPLVF